MQSLFYGGIAQRESLLHEMDAQHGLDGKRWLSLPAFGHVGGDQRDKIVPRNDAFHLAQEIALARAFARLPQSRALLLYAAIVSADSLTDNYRLSRFMQTSYVCFKYFLLVLLVFFRNLFLRFSCRMNFFFQ